MTVWKLYHQLEGLDKAYWMEDITSMEKMEKYASALLTFSSDQGRRTEKLPDLYENVWLFSKDGIRFIVMETATQLLFFWAFPEDC